MVRPVHVFITRYTTGCLYSFVQQQFTADRLCAFITGASTKHALSGLSQRRTAATHKMRGAAARCEPTTTASTRCHTVTQCLRMHAYQRANAGAQSIPQRCLTFSAGSILYTVPRQSNELGAATWRECRALAGTWCIGEYDAMRSPPRILWTIQTKPMKLLLGAC